MIIRHRPVSPSVTWIANGTSKDGPPIPAKLLSLYVYCNNTLRKRTHQPRQISVKTAVQEAKANLQGWSANLSQLKIERKAGDAALKEMTQNVAARLEVKMHQSVSPSVLVLSACP